MISRMHAGTALLCLAASTQMAQAGPFTDDLTKCVVDSTSSDDRLALVKWMFFAISRHPALQGIATASEEQMEASNKQVGELFMRLLLEDCQESAKKALQFEGSEAISTSFELFGQIAGQEMFSSPEVGAATSGLSQHLDTEKLKALGEP